MDEYDWNGNLVWQYAYDSPTHLAHHDFEVLPNGNILLVAWEYKSEADATAAGRDPNLPGPGYMYPDSIVEVQPDIPNGTGTIVWEWHIWDHLVQDFDAAKSNYYGATGVQDHPELINLNYVSTDNDGAGPPEDWTHCNGIDYNPQLDQIVLSSREFSEFWIIDHSTTTAQAASHSGGRSGHGGDLLYRYGNPQTYDRGTAADRVFYYQHDPKWIPDGTPGAGDITVFNNGVGRPNDQNYTSVDEITPPPVDANGNYELTAGQAYGPSAPTWIYVAPPEYFSAIIGSATRLPNGDTLIDYGVDATFSEVTPAGQEVWKYVSPYTAGGTLGPTTPIPSLGLPPPILSSLYANFTFQAIYYPTIQVAPQVDLNGAAIGTGNTAGWFNSGAVPIADMADASITAPSGLANLTGMTVVLSSFHAGDVLSVPSVFGISGITSSYSTGTLSLSGSNSVANYQKLLRLINYDNTSGGPGVSSFTATVTATDGVLASNPVTATINSNVLSGEVLGNRLFYNGSKYDNNHTAIEPASDALAIASDKIGFNGSGTATFASVSSFSKGITGVMVDLQSGLGAHGSISLADISFKTSPAYSAGTYNNIGTWNTAPTPSGFSVILGGGTNGSDRIEITWNAGDIANEWLEVNVDSNVNTGLSSPDIFYFGNAVGDSGLGNTATQINVDPSDVTAARDNVSPAIGTTPAWKAFDFNKDGIINASDVTLSRNNAGFVLHFIASPTGPFAPSSGDSGISSGLVARSSSPPGSSSVGTAAAPASHGWLIDRLATADHLQSSDVALHFQALAVEDIAAARLSPAAEDASETDAEDEMLAGLLADLGLR